MAAGAMAVSMFPDISQEVSLSLKIYTTAAYKLWPDEYKNIIDTMPTDLLLEKVMNYEGPGAGTLKGEGLKSSQERIYEGNIESFSQKTYSLELPVTLEQRWYAYKNAGFMQQLGTYLSRSMKILDEYDSANVINNGFSATAAAGYDGKAYFAADHTWRSDSSLYDNLLNPVDMGRDPLETGIQRFAYQTMEFGIPMAARPEKINISWENLFTLPELLKSIRDPESANNTHNALKDQGLSTNLNHYLTDTDGYVIDSERKTRRMYRKQKTKFDSYFDQPTMNLVERAHNAHAVGFVFQAASMGSQGG